jgi:serine/threonine protein kinase
MAPEILTGKKYSKMSDVWALGITLYTMITGSTPFYNESQIKEKDLVFGQIFRLDY